MDLSACRRRRNSIRHAKDGCFPSNRGKVTIKQIVVELGFNGHAVGNSQIDKTFLPKTTLYMDVVEYQFYY